MPLLGNNGTTFGIIWDLLKHRRVFCTIITHVWALFPYGHGHSSDSHGIILPHHTLMVWQSPPLPRSRSPSTGSAAAGAEEVSFNAGDFPEEDVREWYVAGTECLFRDSSDEIH